MLIGYGYKWCTYTQVSEHLLSIYLDEYGDTPWDALKYLVRRIIIIVSSPDRRVLPTCPLFCLISATHIWHVVGACTVE